MDIKNIIFDLETTGFPQRMAGYDNYYHPSKTKYYNSSRIVSISMIIEHNSDKDNTIIDFIIKPDGYSIDNSQFHGITNEIANEKGISMNDMLDNIAEYFESNPLLIAHNIIFDYNILLSECHRLNKTELINNITKCKAYCTMKKSKNLLKLNKYPKLSELYTLICNKELDSSKLHTSEYDTQLCYDIYCSLMEKNNKT